MTTSEAPEISSDDRVMAALAHFFGIFGALIVWATQKDRSRFVKFQALQSLAFGGLLSAVTLLAMLCLMGLMLLGIVGALFASAQPGASPDRLTSLMIVAVLSPMSFYCLLPVSLAEGLVQMIAAVSVATGHNWRYPIIAQRVEAFMDGPAKAG